MIPAIELTLEAKHKVFVYFPPSQYSSNLATITGNQPILMKRYESRFKQSLLPDVVHLQQADYDIAIPDKWKQYQKSNK